MNTCKHTKIKHTFTFEVAEKKTILFHIERYSRKDECIVCSRENSVYRFSGQFIWMHSRCSCCSRF